MRRIRCLFFLFNIVYIFSQNADAQTIVFEKTESRHQKLQRFDLNQETDKNTVAIINEIAKSVPKSPDVTSFIIDFESMIQIKVIDSLRYRIFCELKAMRFSGDIFYRGLNISHLLIPDMADFQFTVYCTKQASQKYFTRSIKDIRMFNNMGYFTLLQNEFTDSLSGCEYTASIDTIRIYFSDSAFVNFRSGIELINDYFASDRRIDNMLYTINQIDINRIDRLSFNSIVLREIEQDYKSLMSYDLFNRLSLWQTDPINFSGRMEQLGRTIEELRFEINKKIENLDRLFYEHGIESMQEKNYDSARYFFAKAAEYNSAYAPALIEMAYLDYLDGKTDSAAIRILYILDNTIPSVQDIQRLDEVSMLNNGLISEQVKRRLISQDFVDAQYLLELSIKICFRSTHLNCLDDMQKLMAQVKYGLYKSLLTVVEKAVENKRFEIAWQYIKNALSFQQQNSEYIISPLEIEKYYSILFNACISEIELFNQKKLYLKSSEMIQWLESLCDTVPQFQCSGLKNVKIVTLNGLYNERLDKIEQDILKKNYQAAETRMKLLSDYITTNPELTFTERFKRAESEIYLFYYQSEIAEAISNIEYGFYEPAWDHLLKATEIQEVHNLPKYQNIDNLFKMVAEPVFSKKFRNIIINQSSFTVTTLISNSDDLNDVIEKSGIILSDSLLALRNTMKMIVKSRYCDSISEVVRLNLSLADSLTEAHRFLAADSVYHKISVICINLLLSCNCQNESVQEQKKKLSYGVEWEQQLGNIRKLEKQQSWEELISKYKSFAEISTNQYVYMWGVKFVPLEDFILQNNSPSFILAGFDYFYELKEYDKAFLMLDALRKLNFPVNLTSDIQKKIGNKLAVRDKIENQYSNYKINILKYTEGEEYFSYFSKSYRKMWKKY